MESISIIGTGNMGSGVAKAIAASGMYQRMYLSNKTASKAEALSETIPNSIPVSNLEAAEKGKFIFLGVKPIMMKDLLEEISPVLKRRSDRYILCSMAASVSCEMIQQMIGMKAPIIRLMPNLPILVGCGVTEYCGVDVEESEMQQFESFFSSSGITERIEERLMDAASAISGCGPAFAYMFAEALADGGVACGLKRDQAIRYAAGMMEGAAKMILSSGKHPGTLKDEVCSPGGTTIQGVRKLEESGFRAAAMNAVIASYKKAMEK